MGPSDMVRERLWFENGGDGGPVLVLLHGLGANAGVWAPMMPIIERRWPHRWIAPDFRGHGRSGWGGPYGYGVHAADVAAIVGGQDEEVVVLGHSMGGAVGMALATGWFGVTVRATLAFGVKLGWTSEEVQRLKGLSAKPVRWMDDHAETIGRYLRISGLAGLVADDSPLADAGVVETDGRFRLAADNAINAVAGPDPAAFYRAAGGLVRLAAGASDPMCTAAEMRALDPKAVVIDGLGHNCHVESPEVVWNLFEQVLEAG